MITLTTQEKIDAIKYALFKHRYVYFYICDAISGYLKSIEKPLYTTPFEKERIFSNIFPEIWKHEPTQRSSGFAWFEDDIKGETKRRDILKAALLELETQLKNETV